MRVLIVDDDPLVRYAVGRMLAEAGYETVEAENGRRAIDRMIDYDVGAVVSDIIMPDMEGIETIRRIRAMAPHVPIVAMSAGGRSKNVDHLRVARGLGADRTLAKPFAETELLAALEQAIADRSHGAARPSTQRG
jgi:CheY-like chemotaxis protein